VYGFSRNIVLKCYPHRIMFSICTLTSTFPTMKNMWDFSCIYHFIFTLSNPLNEHSTISVTYNTQETYTPETFTFILIPLIFIQRNYTCTCQSIGIKVPMKHTFSNLDNHSTTVASPLFTHYTAHPSGPVR